MEVAHNTPIQKFFNCACFGKSFSALAALLMVMTTSAAANELIYTIHVGPNGYAPYFIVKKEGSEYVYSGIIHDFLDGFDATNYGYKHENMLMTRKRANAKMSQDQAFDLMFNSPLFVSDEILEHYEFSVPVLTSTDVVFSRKDQNLDYQKPEDLFEKSVGVIRGYGYGAFDPLLAEGIIKGVQVDAHTQAIGMLEKKRVDAYLGNIHVSPWYMVQMNLNPDDFNMSSVPMYQFEFGFLVSKRRPKLLAELNAFIKKSTADGTIEALVDKYTH